MIRDLKVLFAALAIFSAVCFLQARQTERLKGEPPPPAAQSEDTAPAAQETVAAKPQAAKPQAARAEEIARRAAQRIRAAVLLLAARPPAEPVLADTAAVPPRLAIVIDDFGNSIGIARKIASLGLTATWAVIPDLAGSRAAADLAEEIGQPYLLHLPMQAFADPTGGREYKIGVDTPEKKIYALVEAWHAAYPGAIGINNHRGSRATSDRKTMIRFMKAVSKTGWGFLDSRTSGKTIAHRVAAEYDIPVALNNVFIDGSPELAKMKKQFALALKRAQAHGSAVAICHAREKTIPFLEYLQNADLGPVQLVTLSALWEEQYAARRKYDER
ncbi:MAG: divergent polysaccharide deacetylase family protein [Pyramidobacter sp.]|nr:divergent polysaccharide deacetylase family protein [Pyramidobacter sp.]